MTEGDPRNKHEINIGAKTKSGFDIGSAKPQDVAPGTTAPVGGKESLVPWVRLAAVGHTFQLGGNMQAIAHWKSGERFQLIGRADPQSTESAEAVVRGMNEYTPFTTFRTLSAANPAFSGFVSAVEIGEDESNYLHVISTAEQPLTVFIRSHGEITKAQVGNISGHVPGSIHESRMDVSPGSEVIIMQTVGRPTIPLYDEAVQLSKRKVARGLQKGETFAHIVETQLGSGRDYLAVSLKVPVHITSDDSL